MAEGEAVGSGVVAGATDGVGALGVVKTPGKVMPLERLPPKNVWRIKFITNHAEKTRMSPMTAAMIWLLAVSTFALSPPEVIHLIPPQIR